MNLQKLAWMKKETGLYPERTYYLWWFAGMFCMVFGSVFDFSALLFGPQSVIAPLGALTMATNGFTAPCMLGEKLRKGVVTATVFILVCCDLVCRFLELLYLFCFRKQVLFHWNRDVINIRNAPKRLYKVIILKVTFSL
jgi:hypothetical protein